MFAAYVIGLLATVLLACLAGWRRGDTALPMVACALFYNWAVNQLVVSATAVYNPWQAFIATDGLCFALVGALAVTTRGVPRIMALALAAAWGAQLWLNIQFGQSDPSAEAEWAHWRTLTWIAFGQLAIVLAWAAHCLNRERRDA